LLLIDALDTQFRRVKLRRDPECPACGTREIKELIDYDAFCGIPDDGPPVAEITPGDLAARIRAGEDVQIIDVREPHEWEICRIPSARLVPLTTLAGAMSTLDDTRDVFVYCKSGVRSAQAVRDLKRAGLTRVWNVAGGVLRWSTDVDANVPRY
jgi:sulfur-carrier protein adenylyltransferase/sulfurtransferase